MLLYTIAWPDYCMMWCQWCQLLPLNFFCVSFQTPVTFNPSYNINNNFQTNTRNVQKCDKKKSTRRLPITSELRGGSKGLFYNRLSKQRHLKPPITASCSTLTTGCEEMRVFFATMVRHSLISARPPSRAQRGFNGRIPHFPQWLKGLHLHVMKKVVTVFKYSRFFSRLYFTK